MKEQLTAQITRIVAAVRILSPESFSFAGQTFTTAHAHRTQAQEFARGQHPLVSLLEQNLYNYCYSRTFNGQIRADIFAGGEEENFTPLLSAANASRERWDRGWQIQRLLPSGQILAAKNSMTRSLWPGEFISLDAPGLAPRPGLNISVFFMRESTTMQTGFYFAFGETQTGDEDFYSLVRFYWNVQADGAATLTRLVTEKLNRFQVPFRFKCLNNRAYFTRHDSAVLFVNRRFYRITAELLADVHAGVRERLRAETPLFTKRLADGLGLAEEPYTGESFGMERCRILAEALWNAHQRGVEETDARLAEVTQHFATYGLSLERPHLNPGSIDQYDFPVNRRP